MRQKYRTRVREILRQLAPEDYQRLEGIEINDLGFGYDPFGLERESVMLTYAVGQYFYNHWFRVESWGVENVPAQGPALITPNHSGGIPIDGMMIAIDLLKKLERPRIMRSVVYNFAGLLPFVNTFFYRNGQVVGARRNFEELLQQGDLVAVFPEGAKEPWKGLRSRYKLRPFNVGFMELSLLNRTPIVPTVVIGAEEQYPFMVNVKPLAKVLGFPYFPLSPLFPLLGPVGMLPLPTKYQIYYGEPFHFYREHGPRAVEDPEIIRKLVAQVRRRIEDMIQEGLSRRKGVFGFPFFPRRASGASESSASAGRSGRARKTSTASDEVSAGRP